MACCGGGYREDRFQTSIAGNFICASCQKVLKDPVQCHNEHYFCKACITQHLKNSQTCPVCMEKVTEEKLHKPPRIVTNILNALIINCDHSERGCTQLIELVRLEDHTRSCNYKPVTCPNEKCAKIMNLADFEEHTSEVCEYRQVYCDECEKDMSFKKYQKHSCVISKDVLAMKASLTELQDQVKEMSKAQNEMFEAIKNLTADVKTRDEIPQGNIVVVGGRIKGSGMSDAPTNSVEMYSLGNRTWRMVATMKEERESLTSHIYNGQVMVAGGGRYVTLNQVNYVYSEYDENIVYFHSKSIEYIQIPLEAKQPNIHKACPDESSSFVLELPTECTGHKTAIINNHLWMVGGYNTNKSNNYLNTIYTTPIKSPFNHTAKCQMSKPLAFHGLEVVNENELLIMGGETLDAHTVDSVLLYNTVTNTLREMHPLPFPMSRMATVKHEEDVIVIGGRGKKAGNTTYLNSVFKYNCKKNEWEQLPGMKHKRSECAAVISGNKVFVMGGYSEGQGYLSSVECFDIKHQVWHELPSMSQPRHNFAAVLVP